jgi:Predicted hydrolases or acyltransferases (alpha/beta hydrolase superfamily)
MKQPIEINGLKLEINIEEQGKGDQTLLMVHGIPTNARLWRHVQDHLKDKYRTLAMDMVGYGQSGMPFR